jgi:hypothetical protein
VKNIPAFRAQIPGWKTSLHSSPDYQDEKRPGIPPRITGMENIPTFRPGLPGYYLQLKISAESPMSRRDVNGGVA